MKTSVAIALTLACFTAGCAGESTMVRKVVTPHDAAARDPDAHVIAVEHADGTRSKPSKHVAADDLIVVDVPGASADANRGEHLVRYHASKPEMIAGVSLIGVGAGVAALASACRTSGIFQSGVCIGEVVAIGSTLALTGMGLLIAGMQPHAYVERNVQPPRVQVTPTFDAHGAGGMFRLTF